MRLTHGMAITTRPHVGTFTYASSAYSIRFRGRLRQRRYSSVTCCSPPCLGRPCSKQQEPCFSWSPELWAPRAAPRPRRHGGEGGIHITCVSLPPSGDIRECRWCAWLFPCSFVCFSRFSSLLYFSVPLAIGLWCAIYMGTGEAEHMGCSCQSRTHVF